MAQAKDEPISGCHVVAMPYPGRGHINPMLNLCKLLLSRRADILVTFVVTEEWLGLLGSDTVPANFNFATIPNVVPSEVGRGADFISFFKAALTKLEEPFERLLDRLVPPRPSVIIYDTYMTWVVGVGNRRNIPVASFWTMSAWVFSAFHHFHLLQQNGHHPADVSERGKEVVDYIPGIPSTRLVDLPTVFYGDGAVLEVLKLALESISSALSKAQFLLFTTIYEIESEIFDALKPTLLPITTYPIGPTIPYFTLEYDDATSATRDHQKRNYMQWLDSQPDSSVLYISQGSFLSLSASQMSEIIAGVRDSGIRYFWVMRGETSQMKDGYGEKGMVVAWCDQLKVLCHPAMGGFWSHCGWNSTKECLFAGLPMLTFPILWDQSSNSKRVVEDWKIGLRVRREIGDDGVVTRDEVSGLLRRFMDLESEEGKGMRKRARQLREVCEQAVGKGGSVNASIDAFIHDICKQL